MDGAEPDKRTPETAISDEAREDRERAEREVAERHREETSPDPHHALANPAHDPDPTEYPDPYERRPDPRDPGAVDTPADPAEDEPEHGPTPRDRSTSDPPPPRNLDRAREGEGDEP